MGIYNVHTYIGIKKVVKIRKR